MALIFDGKIVSPVVTKEVAKTKFGASVDNFLGDVDENGTYVAPTEPFAVNLAGVKSVGAYAFYYKFPYSNITEFVANDLKTAGNYAFNRMCESCKNIKRASFDAVEELNGAYIFAYFFYYADNKSIVSFAKLKKAVGNNIFGFMFSGYARKDGFFDKTFPALEELGGDQAMHTMVSIEKNTVRMSKLKKVAGGSASYNASFSGFYSYVFYLPRASDLSRYVFVSSVKEIHFAAQNQATIEALPDYATKFGGTNATVYFDLMLQITVNGVAYEREHTIDGYTSWKDASGNLVYTDKTAEPAVGTVVYSDQGTTQVGTVEGVV